MVLLVLNGGKSRMMEKEGDIMEITGGKRRRLHESMWISSQNLVYK